MKVEKNLVSIIVPIYNQEVYLEKCILSLLEQTYETIEIILIDDGSNDKSAQICDLFSKSDSRIRVFHKTNGGVSSARNKGLAEAKGKYISFVDPDDWVESDYIERLVNTIKQNDVDFSYCSYFIDENMMRKSMKLSFESGIYTLDEVFSDIFFGCRKPGKVMSTSLVLGLFNKDIIDKNNIVFDESIRKAEDWLFYSMYLPQCKKIGIINHQLYHYVQNDNSIMHQYYVPTEIGVEKSLYILEQFVNNMRINKVNIKWYQEKIELRYATSAIRYAVGIYDKRNSMSLIKKHKKIKVYIKKHKIYKKITKISYKYGFRQLIEVAVVKSRSAFLLDLYAILYLIYKRNFI